MEDKNERVFKIPEFEYFDMGGKYSGSKRGCSFDDFSFRITPKEKIAVQIWYNIKCFELSETEAQNEFELTHDGYHSACDWIEEQYKIWLKEHTPKNSTLGYYSEKPAVPEWLILEDK